MGIQSSPPPLDDDDRSSSSSSGLSTGSLGFGACFGFLERSLAHAPSVRNLWQLALHSKMAWWCFCTISFHSASIAAFAAFLFTLASHLYFFSSAFFSWISFWSRVCRNGGWGKFRKNVSHHVTCQSTLIWLEHLWFCMDSLHSKRQYVAQSLVYTYNQVIPIKNMVETMIYIITECVWLWKHIFMGYIPSLHFTITSDYLHIQYIYAY